MTDLAAAVLFSNAALEGVGAGDRLPGLRGLHHGLVRPPSGPDDAAILGRLLRGDADSCGDDAIAVLPAVIGFAGHRLTPKPESRVARRERLGAAAVMGERWARFVTRHPSRTVVIGVIALLVLAIPALSLRLALADNGSAATDTTQRQAYDLIAAEFGPGFNGPLTLLVHTHPGTNPQTAAGAVAATVKTLPNVLTVTPPNSATTAGPPSCRSSPAAARTTVQPPTSSRPSATKRRRWPQPMGQPSR